MRDHRAPQHHGHKPRAREHSQPEPKLDNARALSEIKRYLDVAVREMGLEIEFDITEPGDGGRRSER